MLKMALSCKALASSSAFFPSAIPLRKKLSTRFLSLVPMPFQPDANVTSLYNGDGSSDWSNTASDTTLAEGGGALFWRTTIGIGVGF
jgi:hypothetical protein